MFKTCVDHILREIRKQGVWALPKIGICKLFNIWENRAPWPIKVRFWRNLARLIFVPNYKKKRILGIWDYRDLPWSVGDPLLFIGNLSTLKPKHNAEEIDICIVYDRKNPGGNRYTRNITSENAQDYMLDFLPLFSTCPYLGSIYQFSSRIEFNRFLKYNLERYIIFPPLSQHFAETYNFSKGGDISRIKNFYYLHGYIPYLRFGEREVSWAYFFYLKHLPKGTIPVTLLLKKTSHDPHRNADPAVWLSFIKECKKYFPEVVFVLVGLKEEVFDEIQNLPNVIIAKNFGTSVIDDLALIRTSLLYMGGSDSGPIMVALFSDLPYLIFKVQSSTIHRIMGLKPGEKLCFATENQKMFDDTVVVTPELLFNEFKALYSKLDRNKWRSLVLENARIKHGHPSAVVEKNE